MTASRITSLLMAIATQSGCSWLFQEHLPKDPPRNEPPRCSTTPGWWVADGAFVLLDASFLAGASQVKGSTTDGFRDAVVFAIVDGLVHLGSAVSGYKWAHACEDEISAYTHAHAEPIPTADQLAERREAAHRAGLINHCFGYTIVESGEGQKVCKQTVEACAAEHARLVGDRQFAEMTECAEVLPAVIPTPTEQCFEYDVVENSERKTICKPTLDECVVKRDEIVADRSFTAVKPCKGR